MKVERHRRVPGAPDRPVVLGAERESSTFLSTSGSGYEAEMGRWSRRLAPLLIDFAGVRAAERVLDVGCGTGSLTCALAQNAGIRRIDGG